MWKGKCKMKTKDKNEIITNLNLNERFEAVDPTKIYGRDKLKPLKKGFGITREWIIKSIIAAVIALTVGLIVNAIFGTISAVFSSTTTGAGTFFLVDKIIDKVHSKSD
jgi:hypothetical protein